MQECSSASTFWAVAPRSRAVRVRIARPPPIPPLRGAGAKSVKANRLAGGYAFNCDPFAFATGEYLHFAAPRTGDEDASGVGIVCSEATYKLAFRLHSVRLGAPRASRFYDISSAIIGSPTQRLAGRLDLSPSRFSHRLGGWPYLVSPLSTNARTPEEIADMRRMAQRRCKRFRRRQRKVIQDRVPGLYGAVAGIKRRFNRSAKAKTVLPLRK